MDSLDVFVRYKYCTSLLIFCWELTIASAHELLEFAPVFDVEQRDGIALSPIVDGSDPDLPCENDLGLGSAL